MLPGWRATVLLLLLLQACGSQAQSGDGDSDIELQLSCVSHISITNNSLTCQLLRRSSDEEDEEPEAESIHKMSVCLEVYGYGKKWRCFHAKGDTVTSQQLLPTSSVNVTVKRKGGGTVSAIVKLRDIVKPLSPKVWNVTLEPQLRRAVVFMQIPYSNDYLTLENQLFQFNLWTKGSNITQNISSQNFLPIDMQHLRQNSEYEVRVRAIPNRGWKGTWSEWSEVYTFEIPGEPQWQTTVNILVVSFSSVVLLSLIIIFWRNKIFTYMWPSVPHPKQTLIQICKPNKGLLLNLNPEVFSSLKVYPQEEAPSEEAEPSLGPAAAGGSPSSSAQSSDCRSTTSISTEELEISALLSRSSSDGEDSLPRDSTSPVNVPQQEDQAGNLQPDGLKQPEEAYVTMSSFYQIK
ncbi:interleukin-7 receptor subunit alpha [Cyprinodon tularosa]|uniref:interleukin-7 receptor subunit alpha n=1 Tax=Cyprinodon tularosa TaxID=77115 RepID=UPI0018E271FF|nr:interleukin-7 receptor subunit alpha [Cyprinodon tularosa]